MNVLFINPCLRYKSQTKYPPVGIACILTACEKAGYSYDFIDMDVDELTVDDVDSLMKGKNYDVVGLGCIVTAFKYAKELAEVARRHNPNCLIIFGNSLGMSIMETALTRTEADILVIGEGDITIVELLEKIKIGQSWKNVPGIAYLKDGEVTQSPHRPVISDLDILGFPNWTLFNLKKYISLTMASTVVEHENYVLMPLNAARGCPYSCTFCYHCFKGQKYRHFSAKAIRAEFVRLYEQFHATEISLWDELTFDTLKSTKIIVESLESLPFSVTWSASSRANLFDKKSLPLAKRAYNAGCRSIGFSIENADPDILKAMNKKIDHNKTIEHVATLHEAGITPLTSIVFGYPQETPETIKKTLDLCERCNIYPSVGYLMPLPGTVMYTYAQEKGYITDEFDYVMRLGDRQDLHVNLTSMSDNEFIDCVNSNLRQLANRLGVKVKDPMKTGVYQKPKTIK